MISVSCDMDAQILKAVKALIKGGKEGTEKVLKKTAKEGVEESAEVAVNGIVKSSRPKAVRSASLYKKGDAGIRYRRIAGKLDNLVITARQPYARVFSVTPTSTYELRAVLPESLLHRNFTSSVSAGISRLNTAPVPKSLYNASPVALKKSASKARYGAYKDYYRGKIQDVADACQLSATEQKQLLGVIQENPQYAKQFRKDPYEEALMWKNSKIAQTQKSNVVKRRKPRTPNNGINGKWNGEKGNSEYVFDPNVTPPNKNYSNLEGKTFAELGDDVNDKQPSVNFRNNYPVFDKDGGTPDGKPLQVFFENGIGEYIDSGEVLRKKGKDINREKLHEEVFKRLAKQLGKTVDEIKVFKGDLAAAERLAGKWNCSVDEVFRRCNNPKRVQRVPHECEDGKTVQLVPRIYHEYVPHNGGVERVAAEILAQQH